MTDRNWLVGSITLAVLAAVTAGAWYALQKQPGICELSGRPIHDTMRTIGRSGGRKVHACCPRCPLTLARQTGETVEFLRVTDYATSRPLDPARAFFISDSRVQVCYAPRLKLDEARTPYVQLFDRCGPSLLAFAREEDARAFIAVNGGSLKRLSDLLPGPAAGSQPAPKEEEAEVEP